MAIAEVGSGSQRATIRASSVDSANAAFPGNVTAGNLLLVVGALWESGSGVGSISVTDTRSTSYSVVFGAGVNYSGGFGQPFIAYGIAPSSGACTVTVNPAGSTAYINAVIDEFSGVNASPLDVNGGESTGNSAAPSDGLTTLTAGALVVGSVVTFGARTFTVGSGYTQLDEDETGDRQPYSAEFKIAGGAGAQTVDWTLDSGTDWSVYTAAFKPPAAGGATPGTHQLTLLGVGN